MAHLDAVRARLLDMASLHGAGILAGGICAKIDRAQLWQLYWRGRCCRGGGSARCVIVTEQGVPARLLRCVRRASPSATAPESAAHWKFSSSSTHMTQHRQLPCLHCMRILWAVFNGKLRASSLLLQLLAVVHRAAASQRQLLHHRLAAAQSTCRCSSPVQVSHQHSCLL